MKKTQEAVSKFKSVDHNNDSELNIDEFTALKEDKTSSSVTNYVQYYGSNYRANTANIKKPSARQIGQAEAPQIDKAFRAAIKEGYDEYLFYNDRKLAQVATVLITKDNIIEVNNFYRKDGRVATHHGSLFNYMNSYLNYKRKTNVAEVFITELEKRAKEDNKYEACRPLLNEAKTQIRLGEFPRNQFNEIAKKLS